MFLSLVEKREPGNWEKEEERKRERESGGRKGGRNFFNRREQKLNHEEYTLGV